MEESIQYAKKYLEDVLSFFGLNTEVHATTDEDEEVIILNVPSSQYNGFLIGQHGDTVRSLQFLVGCALRNNEYECTRVNIDIADYKKQRADRLSESVKKWAKNVLDSDEQMELRPMNSADRRTVHKTAEEAGVTTESIGEGRDRHIIIKPIESETKKPKKAKKSEEPKEEVEVSEETKK